MRTMRAIIPTLLLASTVVWAEGRIEEVRRLSAKGSVEIENIAGSIEVRGWDRNEVELTGRLGRGTRELEIEGDENSLSIEVVLRSGRNIEVEGSDLKLRVPRGIELRIESVSADIEVQDLTGFVEIESVSGTIRVGPDPEEVDVESVSGRIEIEAGPSLQEASVETVSGKTILQGVFHRSGDYDLETVSGSLEVRVPPDLCAEFDVETFSGEIDNELGPDARKTSRYVPSQELHFSTCSGGARFTLSSFSGRVRILER